VGVAGKLQVETGVGSSRGRAGLVGQEDARQPCRAAGQGCRRVAGLGRIEGAG